MLVREKWISALLFLLFVQASSVFAIDCRKMELPTNTPPVAMNDIGFARSGGVPVAVLDNDIRGSSGGALGLVGLGPCNGPGACTSITTSNGGQATIQGTVVFYTPPAVPVADTFTYTMHDTTQPQDMASARVDMLISGDLVITYNCTGGNCSFTAHPAITTGIRRYLWTWGDATPNQPVEASDHVNHTYTAAGSYNVSATVEYWDGHNATGGVVAVVGTVVDARWNVTTDGLFATVDDFDDLNTLERDGVIVVNWSQNANDCYEGCGPLSQTTSFALVGGINTCSYSYCWATGQYKRAGTYTGTLRFSDSTKPPLDFPLFITVQNGAPNPTITFTRPDPNVRRLVFTGEANDDGPYPIGPFEWDFGDGATYVDPTGQSSPAHTYTNAGYYDVSLKVRDAEEMTGVTTVNVHVANTPPVPVMTVNCQLLDCTFTADRSIDDGTTLAGYLWNFDDGTTATTAQVVKQYEKPGCPDVSLKVTDSDTVSTTIHRIVPVGPPISGGRAGVVVDAHVQSFLWNQTPGTTDGNLNGIFEPGETAVVEPTWAIKPTAERVRVQAQNLTTTDWEYARPEFRDYVSDYDVSEGFSDCWSMGRCYAVKLFSNASGRNTVRIHNDITFQETDVATGLPTPGSPVKVHVGASFNDVAKTHWAYPLIESALHFGITGGCGGLNYCPETQLTRAQIASWLLKAKYGEGWQPPACVEPGPFNDVPCTHAEARWIQQLEAEGLTTGTGGGNYSPEAILPRAELTIFVLRAIEGGAYAPPRCEADFADVQCPGNSAANWISEAKRRGISIGCSANEYCPDNAVDRAQAAAMLVRAFDMRLDRTACPANTPQYDSIPGHVIRLPIQSLTFTPSPVTMDTEATGTITLAWPVGAAVLIPLTVDNRDALTVPNSVVMPSGQSTTTFTVAAQNVKERTPTRVSATYFNHTKTTQLDVCTPPPAILAQPESRIIFAGEPAQLSVSVDSPAPTYQWYAGVAPSTTTPIGTNSPNLTVSPASTSSYWVLITDPCGSAASATATITVCQRPGIVVQPLREFVAPGTSVTLSVTASGSSPLSYQWYEGASGNTSTPVGTGSSAFTTPALTTNKSYWVRVTSTCYTPVSVDSATAQVTIISEITRRQAASQVAQSQKTITTNWTHPTRPGTLLVAVVSASSQFYPVANFEAPPGWQHATTSDWTGLKTSIYYYQNNPGGRTAETFKNGDLWRDMVLQLTEYVGVLTSGALDKVATSSGEAVPASGEVSTGTTTPTSQARELVVTGLSVYDDTEFSNPDNAFVEVSDRTIGWDLTAALHERVVNAITSWGHLAHVVTNKQWVGAVATFKQAELQPGGCTAGPSITAQPASQTINAGQSAILNVTASGGGTLAYQWYQGTAPSTLTPLGTSASQTVTPPYSMRFWVRVSNACGSIPSNTATIIVCAPPTITAQPMSQTIFAGNSALLSVAAIGGEPFSYQWYEGPSGTTTTPVGENNRFFGTPELSATRSYWVRITSTCNGSVSVNSATATITVQ